MKMIILLLGLFCVTESGAAAGENVSELFQKGLTEEEANHNLPAAIEKYRAAISQFDEQRKMAAAALFRLGECLRKLGKTNEANAQMDRVLREYPETEFAKAIGNVQPGDDSSGTLQAEWMREESIYLRYKTLLDSLKNPAELRQIMPTVFPDDQLTRLLQDLSKAEQEHAVQRRDYADDHPAVQRLTSLIKTINEQIDQRMEGIMLSLQTLVGNHRKLADDLKKRIADSSVGPIKIENSGDSTEDAEIARIGRIMRDSPDLINFGIAQNALGQGHLKVLDFLLDHGFNPNDKDASSGNTLLHAASSSGKKSAAELLLAKGANVNAKNDAGETPLKFAARAGYRALAQLLLNHGANPRESDLSGRTPIHVAVFGKPVLELMLPKISEINIRDANGDTPLHWSVSHGASDVSVTDLLLSNGAEINATNNEGYTTLHLAIQKRAVTPNSGATQEIARRRGALSQITLLLERKANPNIPNAAGDTPLYTAVTMHAGADVVRMLLDHGADINRRAPLGETPLIQAIVDKDESMAMLLLNHNADPNIADNSGNYPITYARFSPSLYEALIKKGADAKRAKFSSSAGNGPTNNFHMDPELAKRYGLLPLTGNPNTNGSLTNTGSR